MEPINKNKIDLNNNKGKEENIKHNTEKKKSNSPAPCNSNSNNNIKNKKTIEKNKTEKNQAAIIKKLENENAHLRKLLITYKLKQNKYENSTETIKKYYKHFQKKSITLNNNSNNNNNNNNNCNLSNIVNNKTENSIMNNQNIMTYVKNSHSNNILEKIIDKKTLIPNKTKNRIRKKNSESCSILLTDGNYAKNLKKSNFKLLRSNSKKNKILISEKKSNKKNNKIKKISRIKMNNRNSNLISNSRDIFDTNKINNAISFLSYATLNNNNYDKRKRYNSNNLNDKFNFKRNKKVALKTSHHSLKIENSNTNLNPIKTQNDHANHSKTNTMLHPGNSKIYTKNIKSFNKMLLANIINHNSFNNYSLKLNNLFDKKRNIRINKKKMNNYHSISSVTDKILYENKFNSSVSSDAKKPKINENEKSNKKNAKNNATDQALKRTENSIDINSLKDKNDNSKDKNKLKYFMSYSSKVKKIITDNVSKNLKNINTNFRNDNKLVNHKKKNNIFFTINKTIIHNMNNTFNNSNNNKNFITNINNSAEDTNNDILSPSLTKSTIGNNNTLYNGINLKKKLVPGYQLINSKNMNNNIKFSIIRSNINNRIIRRLQNKRNIFINKNIL